MNKALYNALSAKGVTQPLAHKAQWKIAAIVSVGKMSRLFSSLKLPSLTLNYNTEYSAAKYVQAIAFNIPQTFKSIINKKKPIMKTKTILLFLGLSIVAGVFNACKKDMVNSESDGHDQKTTEDANLS